MLWQQVLRARHDIERLGSVAPVANLEIFVADANKTTIVAAKHLGVEKLQQTEEDLAVGGLTVGKFGRVQPFPHVDQTLVRQFGRDQNDPPLGVAQQIGHPAVGVLQDTIRTVCVLLVEYVGDIVDIEEAEGEQPVP